MYPLFRLEIITPYRKFFEGDVEMLVFRNVDGEMGVLKGHMPMVASVSIGPIRILKDGEWKMAAVSEGFVEIMPDKSMIFTDAAEWPEEIDVARALKAKERAEQRLNSQMSQIEHVRSQAALARAATRIQVTKRY